MKHLILSLFLTFTIAGAMAQAKGASANARNSESSASHKANAQNEFEAQVNKKADAMTMNMQRFLNISGQQLVKVREINRNSVRQMEEAKVELKNDPKGLYYRIGQISDARLSLIKDVLSPQQFDKYQQKREEKMGIPQSGGGGNSGGASNSGIQVPGSSSY